MPFTLIFKSVIGYCVGISPLKCEICGLITKPHSSEILKLQYSYVFIYQNYICAVLSFIFFLFLLYSATLKEAILGCAFINCKIKIKIQGTVLEQLHS